MIRIRILDQDRDQDQDQNDEDEEGEKRGFASPSCMVGRFPLSDCSWWVEVIMEPVCRTYFTPNITPQMQYICTRFRFNQYDTTIPKIKIINTPCVGHISHPI